MLLLVKGRKPRPICRECRKLHAAKDCPHRDVIRRAHKHAMKLFREMQPLLHRRAV